MELDFNKMCLKICSKSTWSCEFGFICAEKLFNKLFYFVKSMFSLTLWNDFDEWQTLTVKQCCLTQQNYCVPVLMGNGAAETAVNFICHCDGYSGSNPQIMRIEPLGGTATVIDYMFGDRWMRRFQETIFPKLVLLQVFQVVSIALLWYFLIITSAVQRSLGRPKNKQRDDIYALIRY